MRVMKEYHSVFTAGWGQLVVLTIVNYDTNVTTTRVDACLDQADGDRIANEHFVWHRNYAEVVTRTESYKKEVWREIRGRQIGGGA